MDLFHASTIVTVGNGEKNKILALFLVARGSPKEHCSIPLQEIKAKELYSAKSTQK
jgi:hypothetical protein